MSKKTVVALTVILFFFLFLGTVLHHDPLNHESMAFSDTPCCAIALSGMDAQTKSYTTIVFFAATIFVLAVSLATPTSIKIRFYHPPKR